MNSIEDEVSLDYKLYTDGTGFEGASRANKISKLTLGKSVVDRLDIEIEEGKKIKYFKFVGESPKITYNNAVFTTKSQNHYLWSDDNKNVYNSEMITAVPSDSADTNYADLAGKMIASLELNFVPEYKSTDFDLLKVVIPIFKTDRINKNGLELLNCIRMTDDAVMPTKNIDIAGFLPKETSYFINKFEITKPDTTTANVGVFIFTSSNIHLDDNTIQPSFFNSLDLLESSATKDIPLDGGAHEWIGSGIKYSSEEKKCREVYNEGETITHAINKLVDSSMKKVPIGQIIGQMIKSPLGLMVMIIIIFTSIMVIYKLILYVILSNIGETPSKAGSQTSVGAWVVFVLVFGAFAYTSNLPEA